MKTDFVLLGARVSFVSRESRRSLVVLIYAGFAAAEIAWFLQRRIVTPAAILLGFACFLALTALAGGGYEGGDEREDHRRDHAHYLAFQAVAVAVCAPMFIASMRLIRPSLMSWISMPPGRHLLRPHSCGHDPLPHFAPGHSSLDRAGYGGAELVGRTSRVAVAHKYYRVMNSN